MSASPTPTADSAENVRRAVMRETVCKTILNKSSIDDYSLNCYTGCTHGCVYCYARFMQRFHAHDEPWGEFVDVKINAVEVLKRQLRRLKPGDVFMSSACDGWQPIEAQYELTRRSCQLLLEYGFQVNVLTKSALVLRDLDIFAGQRARVGVTITTLDEDLRLLWEPRAASAEERLRVVEAAQQAGLKTSIMFGPLLPLLYDSRDSLEMLFQRAADLRIDSIWVDALNPRPRVWPAVARLLRDKFPDLHSAMRKSCSALQRGPRIWHNYAKRLPGLQSGFISAIGLPCVFDRRMESNLPTCPDRTEDYTFCLFQPRPATYAAPIRKQNVLGSKNRASICVSMCVPMEYRCGDKSRKIRGKERHSRTTI